MKKKMPEVIKKLILSSKQSILDIIFTFHSFREVRPVFFQHTNFLVLFKTGENLDQFKNKIARFERVEAALAAVEGAESRYTNKSIRIR
jgi:hypothetical protein